MNNRPASVGGGAGGSGGRASSASTLPPRALLDHLRATVPATLLHASNWVAANIEPDSKGKLTKVPYAAPSHRRASVTDPATWGNVEHAAKRARQDDLCGVGYVFAAETPEDHPHVSARECGIDLDHCRNKDTGAIDDWALHIVRSIDSYTEISWSGEGLHIILEGRLDDHARHRRSYSTGGIEVYDRDRFFLMTGDRLEGTPKSVEPRQEALDAVLEKYLPREYIPGDAALLSRTPHPVALSDEELLRRAREAKNGAEFIALYDEGDIGDYDDDHSRADFALCCALAFWTGREAGRIERLFDGSALGKRVKWVNRQDYRARTIGEAIATTHNYYSPAPSAEDGQNEERPANGHATTSGESLGEATSSSVRQAVIIDAQERSFPLLDVDGRDHAMQAEETSAEEDVSHLTRRGKDGIFPLLSLDDLKKVGNLRPEALVAGKIMQRSLNLTYGNEDTGKSYFAQNTCFTLAAAGVPVWYVAAEGFDGIYLRILAWLAKHPGQDVAALRVIPLPVQIFKGNDRAIIAAQARDQPEESRPALIVLDTLHRCTVGARESDNRDMVCVANAAALWRAEFGATSWVIHHEGKSVGSGMRGASCLFDDADSVQYVFRGGDISVIECEKQKDGIPHFEPEAFTLDTCALDARGYPGLSANVVTLLPNDQIIVARRIWAAEQQRRASGAKNAVGGEDAKPLSDTLERARQALVTLSVDHPQGVFKAMWRAACMEAGIKAGSFDWISKELDRQGAVTRDAATGSYMPAKKEDAWRY